MLRRWDEGAERGYQDFKESENSLVREPVKTMSRLTRALMGNIDYAKCKTKRIENFAYLHSVLAETNQFGFDCSDDDVPMFYPYLVFKDGLRERLIENKVYISKFWQGIEDVCHNGYELDLQKYLLPLPIDHRYGVNEMDRILDLIDFSN